ncbi:MAG: lipopolysaccharide biosynthesis protein [Oscillospiraceae bacterium]
MSNSNNKYKTLVSNTMLISLGTFGSKLLVFFMVRFYTSYLTPADYGTADLITQTANLLFPLISLGITDGVFRFAVDHTEQRRNIFSVGVYTILAGAVLLVAILPLLGLFPQFDGFLWLIALYTMCSCFHSLCAQFVRAEGHTALFAVQGMINTVLVIGLNVLFLVGLRMGITGYVLSVALADLACTLLLFVRERLWRQLMLRPGWAAAREMLAYSIPMIPTTVFWWITSVSDRYMVTAYLGVDANGIYAVSYKMPTILSPCRAFSWRRGSFPPSRRRRQPARAYPLFSKVWCSFQSVMSCRRVHHRLRRAEIHVLTTEQFTARGCTYRCSAWRWSFPRS